MFGFWYHFRESDGIELPSRVDVTFFRNSRSVSAGFNDDVYSVRNIANAHSENIQSQNLHRTINNNNKTNDSLLVTQTYLEINVTIYAERISFCSLYFLVPKKKPCRLFTNERFDARYQLIKASQKRSKAVLSCTISAVTNYIFSKCSKYRRIYCKS